MYARSERVLTWVAFLISIAVAVVAILEIDNRSDEAPSVAVPTVEPSPAVAPTPAPATEAPTAPEPEPTEPPAATEPAAPEPPAATEQPPAPPPAAEPPPVAAPPAPGASPMPHTGGGAWPGGLVLVVLAGIGALIARHTEARTSARSSTG